MISPALLSLFNTAEKKWMVQLSIMDDIRELRREYHILKQKYKRLEEKCRDISLNKLEFLNQIKELKMKLRRAKKAGSI